jgi:hypothetical protein
MGLPSTTYMVSTAFLKRALRKPIENDNHTQIVIGATKETPSASTQLALEPKFPHGPNLYA